MIALFVLFLLILVLKGGLSLAHTPKAYTTRLTNNPLLLLQFPLNYPIVYIKWEYLYYQQVMNKLKFF